MKCVFSLYALIWNLLAANFYSCWKTVKLKFKFYYFRWHVKLHHRKSDTHTRSSLKVWENCVWKQDASDTQLCEKLHLCVPKGENFHEKCEHMKNSLRSVRIVSVRSASTNRTINNKTMGHLRKTNLIIVFFFSFIFGRVKSFSPRSVCETLFFYSSYLFSRSSCFLFQGKNQSQTSFLFVIFLFFEQQEHSVTAKAEKFFAENRGRNAFSNANSWAVSEFEKKSSLVDSIDLLGDFVSSVFRRGFLSSLWEKTMGSSKFRIFCPGKFKTISKVISAILLQSSVIFLPDDCSIEDKIAVKLGYLSSVHLIPSKFPFDLNRFVENFPAKNLNFPRVTMLKCWSFQAVLHSRFPCSRNFHDYLNFYSVLYWIKPATRKSSSSNFSEIKNKPETEISQRALFQLVLCRLSIVFK